MTSLNTNPLKRWADIFEEPVTAYAFIPCLVRTFLQTLKPSSAENREVLPTFFHFLFLTAVLNLSTLTQAPNTSGTEVGPNLAAPQPPLEGKPNDTFSSAICFV
jgi:hypothetical protein